QGTHHFSNQLGAGGGFTEELDEFHIRHDHATGNPAQQRGAKGHHDREAINQLQNQGATPDNDRHAHDQTKDNQTDLMIRVCCLSRTGNRDHVVQTHHKVGNDDGFNGFPQSGTTLNITVTIFFRNQELDADPDQQQGTHHFQVRHGQQGQGKGNQDHAQANGAGRTPQNSPDTLLGGQVTASQCDNHGVIAPQQYIDQDDLKYCRPAHCLQKLHHV